MHRFVILTALAFSLMSRPVMGAAAKSPAQGSTGPGAVAPQAPDAAFPAFLPPYYAPALKIDGTPLHLTAHEQKGDYVSDDYASADQVVTLSVGSLKCDDTLCPVAYNNAAGYFNAQIAKNSGKFVIVTPTEFRVDWQTGLANNFSFVFRMPHSLLLWTYSTRLERTLPIDAFFTRVKALADRQRFEEAEHEDNVAVGRWEPQIHDWALTLLKEGKRAQALAVLKDILPVAPFDYQAQMDFVANTDDQAAARESAQAVLNNAEDATLIDKAARFLGAREPTLAALPALPKGERGLQLILVPLPPCHVLLLTEAAKIYERITNIPVAVLRLPDPWRFAAPDRIADQRSIQQAIIAQEGPNTDFTGWTKARYESELLKNVASKDALTKFRMQAYIDKLDKRPGQYSGNLYLELFVDLVAQYRSDDIRTMYVGVTEANIFSGDTNYVFSLFQAHAGLGASILSYSMMMAKTLNEPYESRRRLTERIAKELVPASLKALDIPRPADPSDPYSYASSVARLDQKGLVLSPPVKQALDKFR